jgi:uncharacterized membrane protein YdbT with pleckstrin-like domain
VGFGIIWGMGFPAKLLSEDETVVLLLRQHVKVLIGPLIVLLLVVAGAVVLATVIPAGGLQTGTRLGITIVAALIVARWVVWPYLKWWNEIYVLTNRRLVLRQGVFNRSGHDMPLNRVTDVSFTHSLWQRMLGCGTLVVESAGERGQIRLTDVPKVELVQRTLYRLADQTRPAPRPTEEDMFDPGLGSASGLGDVEGGHPEGDRHDQR